MTAPGRSALKAVTLHVARCKEFPEGSRQHGYRLLVPLTAAGQIDVETWKRRRHECFVHRFWADEPLQRGLLVHRAGGAGGATWAFEYDSPADREDEEEGYRFGDHAFRIGEYVSIREDGELMPFKVIEVR
jgi:hypothetical protein